MQTNSKTFRLVLTALMMSLIMVAILFIRVPIPFTQGYVHLGDAMIFLDVLVLGWKYGAVAAALGGMLSWGVYLLLKGRIESTFYLLVLVGAASAAYAEAAAKLARAPATIFLIPALIPLVPGSYVYYMMSALVLNKLSTMRHYGQLTAEWAFGLAAGIGLIAVLHQIASWKPREKH